MKNLLTLFLLSFSTLVLASSDTTIECTVEVDEITGIGTKKKNFEIIQVKIREDSEKTAVWVVDSKFSAFTVMNYKTDTVVEFKDSSTPLLLSLSNKKFLMGMTTNTEVTLDRSSGKLIWNSATSYDKKIYPKFTTQSTNSGSGTCNKVNQNIKKF